MNISVHIYLKQLIFTLVYGFFFFFFYINSFQNERTDFYRKENVQLLYRRVLQHSDVEVEVYYTLSLEPFAVIVTEAHTPSLSLEPLTC